MVKNHNMMCKLKTWKEETYHQGECWWAVSADAIPACVQRLSMRSAQVRKYAQMSGHVIMSRDLALTTYWGACAVAYWTPCRPYQRREDHISSNKESICRDSMEYHKVLLLTLRSGFHHRLLPHALGKSRYEQRIGSSIACQSERRDLSCGALIPLMNIVICKANHRQRSDDSCMVRKYYYGPTDNKGISMHFKTLRHIIRAWTKGYNYRKIIIINI